MSDKESGAEEDLFKVETYRLTLDKAKGFNEVWVWD